MFFLIFLYLPSAILLIFSFNSGTVPVFPLQDFTTKWYSDAWHDQRAARRVRALDQGRHRHEHHRDGDRRSPRPTRSRAGRFRGRNAITAFALVPLVVPPIVVAVALLMLFRKGPHPIPLSLWTVLAGHVVISLPYCILLLVPRIASIDVRLEEAAHDLGASARRRSGA